MSNVSTRLHAWFFASLLIAMAFSAPLHTPLNNPNEGVRIFMARALVHEHSFAIDNVVRAWGYIDDKATHNGKLYASKAPLPSLMAAAGYAVVRPLCGDLNRPALTRVCRFFGCLLPCVMLLVLLRASFIRLRVAPVLAHLTLTALVIASSTLANLSVLSGHALATLSCALVLSWASEATLHDVGAAAPSHAFGAGFVLALACGSEYPMVLAAVPLTALMLWRAPSFYTVRALALGAAGPTAVVMVAHHAMFGAPWRTGYGALENRGYDALVRPGFFGIGAPHLQALGTSLLSFENGLLFFAPVCALGLWALSSNRVPRATRVVLVTTTLAYGWFIAGFLGWRGGWSVGPRYISELIGLLGVGALLVVHAYDRTHPRAVRMLLAFAVGAGVVSAGLAGALFPHLPDTLRNPVGELVLPLVWRGFSADTVLLSLGASPRVSSLLTVAALALPIAIACASDAHVRTTLLAALFGSAVMLVCIVARGTDNANVAGAELRRMFDNWRPEAGNPMLASHADDPRLLVAVDRGRVAWPMVLRDGCMPAAGAAPSGPIAALLRDVPAGALVVVSDALAPFIVDVIGAQMLVVSTTDLRRHASAGLPCTGDVYAMPDAVPSAVLRSGALGTVNTAGPLVRIARNPPTARPAPNDSARQTAPEL